MEDEDFTELALELEIEDSQTPNVVFTQTNFSSTETTASQNKPVDTSRLNISSLSSNPEEFDKTSLYHYIPSQIADNYKHKTLYPWQVALLENEDVLDRGKNIIYSSPTSGGKTVVSEIIMTRRLTVDKTKVVFLLPFKAIIEEKVIDLNEKFKDVGWKANPYHSEAVKIYDNASFNDDDERVMVCTFERGNSILNGLIRSGKIDEIGTIVIDELHNITDPDRGYILELILTKIIYLKPKIQIVAMSATLPNVDKLASFLNAYLFITDFRPVPLTEHIVHNRNVYNTNSNLVRELPIISSKQRIPDGFNMSIISILSEVVPTLIFCSSKAKCKIFAKFIVEHHPINMDLERHRTDELNEMINTVRLSLSGLDPDLELCLRNGVGFHHSSLTMEEKKLVETLFRRNMIVALLCTTTLATVSIQISSDIYTEKGVNLPARRVIITSLSMGKDTLGIVNYKQAVGRAGRANHDTYGESYLITSVLQDGIRLVKSRFTPMKSCLNDRQISRALLENISTGIIKHPTDILTYLNCTFLSKCIPATEMRTIGVNAKNFLQGKGFLRWIEKKECFETTPLGSATQIANICPYDALKYYLAIKEVLQDFYVEEDLGILYLLASISQEPFESVDTTLSERILDIVMQRKEFKQFVDKKVRNTEELKNYIISVGNRVGHQSDVKSIISRLRRTLVLYDITREHPLQLIAERYYGNKEYRGLVQTIQRDSASKASVLSTFAKYSSFPHFFSDYFKQIKERLICGVRPELLPLAQIPYVGPEKARILFDNGFKTISQVAEEPFENLHNIFTRCSVHVDAQMAWNIMQGAKVIVQENTLPREWLFGNEEDDVFLDNSPFKRRGKKRGKSLITGGDSKKKKDTFVMEVNSDSLLEEMNQRWESCSAFSFCFEFGTKRKHSNPTTFVKNKDEHFVKAFAITFHDEFEDFITSDKAIDHKIDPNVLGKSYYIVVNDNNKDIIKKMMCDKTRTKITFSLKKQQTKLLESWNMTISDPVLDPLIADWVQHPDDSENEKTMEEIYLKFFPSNAFVYTPKSSKHAIVKTSAQCWPIISALRTTILQLELIDMLHFEMSFARVLSSMEVSGIRFNYNWIKHNTEIINAKLDEITRNLNSLPILDGGKLDISNNDHVAFLLFDKLKFKGTERKTNKEILDKLKQLYPDKAYIMESIKEYRALLNIKTHHIQNMPNDIKYCPQSKEFRIFATQMQTTSATGRLSVKNPNLQNIPKDIVISNPFNSQPKNLIVSTRSGFIPKDGYIMLSVDYRNIELRILAHLSKDPTLTGILKNTATDIFEEIARDFWFVPKGEDVPKQKRAIVKQIIYGISYCMGAETLASKMFSDNEDLLAHGEDKIEAAERYKQSFFERYPYLKKYKEETEALLVKNCFVKTIYDRKRFMHDIAANDSSKRAAARRAALNTVSQGSASDIMKIVMIGIYRFMAHFNKQSHLANMMIQIHDELLFEVRQDALNLFAYCAKNIMENTSPLDVPLPVTTQIGDSWGTLTEYQVKKLTAEEKQQVLALSESLGFDWGAKLGINNW